MPASELKTKKLAGVFCGMTLLFLVLFPSLSQAAFFPGNQKFYTLKTKHFYIHYPEGIGPLAEEIRTISEEAFINITTRLDWRPKGRIHMVLTDKSDQANGMASVLPYNFIMLYVAPPDADSPLDHYQDYLRLLVNHELTHIVHIDMHGGPVTPVRKVFGTVVAPNGATPAWMREGMAVYEESKVAEGFGRNNADYANMILRTSVYENKFPQIDQVAGLSVHFPAGTGPYTFGGKFFEWLALKYGEDRMYKFQKEYGSSLWMFSLNNKARRVYGKSFYKLWREFKNDLTEKFSNERQLLEAKGLTHFTPVISNTDSQDYFLPRPGTEGYAYYQHGFDDDAKIVVKPDGKSKERHIKRKIFGQMTFSKTGRYLAFASLSSVEPKTAMADVYYYDIDENKLYRAYDQGNAGKSMRASDPDFSSRDGGQRWIVMVRNFQNTDQLYVFDAYEKKGYVLTSAPEKTQFSSPRFSPGGGKIVVSRRDPDGFRDIIIYSDKGKELTRVTHDIKADNHPVFSNNGQKIYFDSYRTGIANIFSYDVSSGHLTQITNVLDGVFQPMPANSGSEIYVQRYSSENTSIQKFDGGHSVFVLSLRANEESAAIQETHQLSRLPRPFGSRHDRGVHSLDFFEPMGDKYDSQTDDVEEAEEEEEKARVEKKEFPSSYKDSLGAYSSGIALGHRNPPDAKKYHPFSHLIIPRYIIPNLSYFENTVLFGAMIGRNDPLYRHFWSAFVNYRTDAKYVGAGGTYVFTRYHPSFYVGALRYAVDWGDVSVTDGVTITTQQFFEERWQGYGGVAFTLKKHKFNFAYFYENREALTNLSVNLTNMRPYAGVRLRYTLSNYKKYADSISPEDGYQIKINSDFTNSILGSDAVNEEVAVMGDFRYYLEMPWSDHHVLALRAAAGWAWGDQQQFGDFRLGGPFGEGTGVSYSSRVFPLRGLSGITYGGDQVILYSAEYRIPLATNVNWGVGTLPVFLDEIHMSIFSDAGDIRFRTSTSELFSRILVSAGAEIMGNFVLGYGLPITGRIGYGIILTNRDRLGTLTDSTTMQSLRYGSAYFQFGTMF